MEALVDVIGQTRQCELPLGFNHFVNCFVLARYSSISPTFVGQLNRRLLKPSVAGTIGDGYRHSHSPSVDLPHDCDRERLSIRKPCNYRLRSLRALLLRWKQSG
jgi:hypothetical protein